MEKTINPIAKGKVKNSFAGRLKDSTAKVAGIIRSGKPLAQTGKQPCRGCNQ